MAIRYRSESIDFRGSDRYPASGRALPVSDRHASTLGNETTQRMSRNRQQARKAIPETADALISEIESGAWSECKPSLNSIPVEQWDDVVREFAQRCPGKTRDDYVDALRRSQFNNR